ncbi:CoA transferase [Sulfitobacter dubius]|uniref:CoA transferase n=1 Tax=Sulfitobacter dubius TaxID=218673 RepID=UPI003B8A91C3
MHREEVFRRRTLEEWIDCLSKNDVPFSPALTIDEVPRNEQVQCLGIFSEITANDGKSYRVISATRAASARRGHRPHDPLEGRIRSKRP